MDVVFLRDLAAAAGVVTGVLALLLNWRTRRDVKREKKPVLRARTAGLAPRPAGWAGMRVTLRSQSNLGWEIRGVYLWVRGGRIVRYAPCLKRIDVNGPHRVELPETSGRWTAASLEVGKAGSQPQFIRSMQLGNGDSGHEDFLVSVPPSIWSIVAARLFTACSEWPKTRRIRLWFIIADEHPTSRLRSATTRIATNIQNAAVSESAT